MSDPHNLVFIRATANKTPEPQCSGFFMSADLNSGSYSGLMFLYYFAKLLRNLA